MNPLDLATPRVVLEPCTLTRMRKGEATIPLQPPLDLRPGDRVLPMESALIAYRDGTTLATYALAGDALIRRYPRSEGGGGPLR